MMRSNMPAVTSRLPLSSLLSFALVAFTIEFDNEAEHRLPHRTTRHGSGTASGPWLISMAMWLNCLRFVPEQGIVVRELERAARTRTNWDGMRRWGYVYFEPDPADIRPKPPHSALVVRATAKGRVAQGILEPLVEEVENRWRGRFGGSAIDELRSALAAVAKQFDVSLPDCLPILKYGLTNHLVSLGKSGTGAPEAEDIAALPLPFLLARVLLAFALEFERESSVSLAIYADLLRVVDEKGNAVSEIPSLSGVSKEAIAMALGFLAKAGYLKVAALEGKRGKRVLLDSQGMEAREACRRLLSKIERRWAERYGEKPLRELWSCLDRIAGDGTPEGSPLFAGLAPYPDSWRAKVPKPKTLPHFPAVLHRGGYPDGS